MSVIHIVILGPSLKRFHMGLALETPHPPGSPFLFLNYKEANKRVVLKQAPCYQNAVIKCLTYSLLY